MDRHGPTVLSEKSNGLCHRFARSLVSPENYQFQAIFTHIQYKSANLSQIKQWTQILVVFTGWKCVCRCLFEMATFGRSCCIQSEENKSKCQCGLFLKLIQGHQFGEYHGSVTYSSLNWLITLEITMLNWHLNESLGNCISICIEKYARFIMFMYVIVTHTQEKNWVKTTVKVLHDIPHWLWITEFKIETYDFALRASNEGECYLIQLRQIQRQSTQSFWLKPNLLIIERTTSQ